MDAREIHIVLTAASAWTKDLGTYSAFIADLSDGLFGDGRRQRTPEVQQAYETFWKIVPDYREKKRKSS